MKPNREKSNGYCKHAGCCKYERANINPVSIGLQPFVHQGTMQPVRGRDKGNDNQFDKIFDSSLQCLLMHRVLYECLSLLFCLLLRALPVRTGKQHANTDIPRPIPLYAAIFFSAFKIYQAFIKKWIFKGYSGTSFFHVFQVKQQASSFVLLCSDKIFVTE